MINDIAITATLNTTKISDLPEDPVVQIFSFLDDQGLLKTERVCKDWHAIHIKYSKYLDKAWKVKWYQSYNKSFLKKNISWKQSCIDIKRHMAENSMSHFFNLLSLGPMSAYRFYDREITIRKVANSIVYLPTIAIIFSSIILMYSGVFILIPLHTLALTINIIESDFGNNIRRFSESTAKYAINYLPYLGLISSLFISVIILYHATEGLRLNCRNKVRNLTQ